MRKLVLDKNFNYVLTEANGKWNSKWKKMKANLHSNLKKSIKRAIIVRICCHGERFGILNLTGKILCDDTWNSKKIKEKCRKESVNGVGVYFKQEVTNAWHKIHISVSHRKQHLSTYRHNVFFVHFHWHRTNCVWILWFVCPDQCHDILCLPSAIESDGRRKMLFWVRF